MCTTCGCSENTKTTVTNLVTGQSIPVEEDGQHAHHRHSHDPARQDQSENHSHGDDAMNHTHSHAKTITLEQEILAKNDLIAARNRGWFEGRNILALNLVSSPGSGKTTLLVRTILDLQDQLPISVVEGDQETTNDALRIKATGCQVVQINTGTGCHLEAEMLARGLKQLQPPINSLVMIENVGNLVCPALFDLGEWTKVVILSVTEGEDKPIKYPHMFRTARVMIINKTDLLPHVDFDIDRCVEYARSVNPDIQVFKLSATDGSGLENWYHWLNQMVQVSSQSTAD